ncbi:centlein [Protopterus annectens]|uniref:centlein n=1 Tax=Protopterus annectens TaxID=7888 RepID=UPI001CFB6472|nr:centlein [Protopterus annectens]
MASRQNDPAKILLLEELRSVREELTQCQADKEFVWSLWKRLQVANPDLTQAVSLVAEREKQKAEAKDRKVLEILQVKDNKIQELEQQVTGQQQEINNVVQRKIAVDEENALMKTELNDLQQKYTDKSQELKDAKDRAWKREEQSKLVIKKLEEEKEGLSTRCSDLLSNLEKLKKQEAQWKGEKSGIDSKVKTLQDDFTEAKKQMEGLHDKCKNLSAQLTAKEEDLLQKNTDVTRLRRELQELQNIYKQSTEHAAQQAELIQQLQALNADTQNVLRNQENAHTAETISYQKLYNDLNLYYDALKSSEAQLRQSHISLTSQLHQKEQLIGQLQLQLQQALQKQAQHTTTGQLDMELQHESFNDLEHQIVVQQSEINLLKEKLRKANVKLAEYDTDHEDALENRILRAARKPEEPPVKRSRSLSPKSCLREPEELKKLKIAEKKIENLEKLLQLKIQENEELRKSHEKRKERLQVLQTNFKAVKDQLTHTEECGKNKSSKVRSQRAEPWQLQQEDSDAVWNELAYFKQEHKKLLIEKMDLEEAADQLKVQAAMDKATIMELDICLQQEREELLFRLDNDDGVKNSTPKKKIQEKMDQSLQKIHQMEKKLKAVEKEAKRLKEFNEELTNNKCSLKSSVNRLKRDADAREEKFSELLAERQGLQKDKTELRAVIDELQKEVTSLKRKAADATKLKNENEELQKQMARVQGALAEARAAAAMVTKVMSCGQCTCKTTASKVKLKTAKKKNNMRRHQSFLNQSIKEMSNVFDNVSKDGWEDISEDSDSEQSTSVSLGEHILKSTSTRTAQMKKDDSQGEGRESDTSCDTIHMDRNNQPGLLKIVGHKEEKIATAAQKRNSHRPHGPSLLVNKVAREKKKALMQKRGPSTSALQQRIITLQEQRLILQSGKMMALNCVKEVQETNQKLTSRLNLANQRLQVSKQIAQKLTSDLAELKGQKDELEKRLDQMKEQLAQAPEAVEEQSPLTSNQRLTIPPTPPRSMELEIKQLQSKLKNATNETTKQVSTIKALKSDLQEQESQAQQLQEKVSRMERDIQMKRQLIEDLKSRQRANQENDKTYKETIEELEKKIKNMTEEYSSKKTQIDCLKQRLNVAVKEKTQYEQMYRKTKEELDKKNQKIHDLETKVIEADTAMTELETAATQQMHGLALQSEHSLDLIQKKLSLANSRIEELVTFVKVFVLELQKDVEKTRNQIRKTKKEQASTVSKQSLSKAQSLAASILNIAQSDLEEILETEGDENLESGDATRRNDQEWQKKIQKLLEGQLPFASHLMETILHKLQEHKKLTEEYAVLTRDAR